jgi:hypothetical protein
MTVEGKKYVVGKANGIYRIFQVRKNRLGLKTYWMEHYEKLWVKYTGIIRDKSAQLTGREAARRVRTIKNNRMDRE